MTSIKGFIAESAVNSIISGLVREIHRVIQTIREHVVSQEALTGGDEGVGVEEAAPGGVVVAGLQVVQAGLLVKGLAARGIFAGLAGILLLVYTITVVGVKCGQEILFARG